MGHNQPLNLKVLLVEDDPANAQYARRVLNQMGCEVCLAQTGEAALQLYEPGHYDVILLDIRLPQMDGIEFMQRVRAQELDSDRPPVPIEVLTADAFESIRRSCLASGASGFMSKPIRPEQIYQALQAYATGNL